jgi:hypothetical protein
MILFFRLDVVEGVEQEAAGSFSIRIHSPNVESFVSFDRCIVKLAVCALRIKQTCNMKVFNQI